MRGPSSRRGGNNRGERSAETSMRIDIWSDVACPWCYIGKRRLEKALDGFEHRAEVEIHWRSFQLDPGAPAQPNPDVSMAAALGGKYGGGEQAGQQMIDRMEAVAAEEGLLFRLSAAQRASTVDAHRVLHAATAVSLSQQASLKEALLKAYFIDSENTADHEVLVRISVEVGLDEEEVRRVLGSSQYADEVEADLDQAADYGIGGVPFFVLDEKFAISGAQPVEVFTDALQRAWAAGRPTLENIGSVGDDACGPDGCAV